MRAPRHNNILELTQLMRRFGPSCGMPIQQEIERDDKAGFAARPQPQRGSPAHTASRGTGTSRRLNNNSAQNSASTAA